MAYDVMKTAVKAAKVFVAFAVPAFLSNWDAAGSLTWGMASGLALFSAMDYWTHRRTK